MPGEGARTPSGPATVAALLVGLALLIVNVALGGAILAKGLRGEFFPTGAVGSTAASVAAVAGSPQPTEGACRLEVRLQPQDEYPNGIPMVWHNESNIIVKLPDAGCDVGVSPTWTVAAWNYTVVCLAAGAAFAPPPPTAAERHLVKLLRGTLLDANLNGLLRSDGRWETYVATPPNRPVSLFLDNAVDRIEAGAQGAVLVYVKVAVDALETPLTEMTKSPATDVSGPFAEHLRWNAFGDFFDLFQGVEFYNLAGILIQDADESRLCYMQFWALREDEDADGYHDHSNLDAANAFAEIHMATYAANGVSGMQTTLPATKYFRYQPNPDKISATEEHAYNENDQTEVQLAIPLAPGHAHGPLWSIDPDSGKPTRLCSGAVQYPYHRWIIRANGGRNDPRRYSMWVAFEHRPEDARVPRPMLTAWPNAYLQTTLDPANCSAKN